MELWNHVMLRYQRHHDGSLEPLTQLSVDTGMGLERLLMIVQGRSSVYESGLFEPWLGTLPGLWNPDERSLRILSDHLRASIVIIGDGVRPSNTGRGYVLRRLIRRALSTLWRDDSSRTLGDLPTPVLEHTLAHFGQNTAPETARELLLTEQRRFSDLLTRGRKVVARFSPGQPLSEEDFRYLHDTHGLPRELVTELLHGLS